MELFLDCTQMTDRASAHDYLAERLQFPAYYGRNLDALYDCLHEILPCKITLQNCTALSAMGRYGYAILKVFRDLAEEQPLFELIEED